MPCAGVPKPRSSDRNPNQDLDPNQDPNLNHADPYLGRPSGEEKHLFLVGRGTESVDIISLNQLFAHGFPGMTKRHHLARDLQQTGVALLAYGVYLRREI